MMLADSSGRDRQLYNFSAPVDLTAVAIDDALFSELVGTRAFQRLKSIRFLGGIDYLLVRTPNGHTGNVRYTRYQHSLGVARLGLLYSDLRPVAFSERRIVVAAALLHDIGHGPLSHSLEPVFEEVFGFEHHRATTDIVSGRSPLGREVYETLCRHQVDVERILAIIAGEDPSHDGFFSGPINFDTIEGILRARRYAKSGQNMLPPEAVVKAALQRLSSGDRDVVDNFWVQKDHVYRYLINSEAGVLADSACLSFMRRHLNSLSAVDYFSTEANIFRKLPGLRQLLTSPSFEGEVWQHVDGPITYRARRFFIEPMVDFFARDDEGRYRQTSEIRILSPRSAGTQEESDRGLFHDKGNRSGKGVL